MVAGMKTEEKRLLKLTRAEDYYYLTQGGSTTCEGMDDAEEFAIIRGAMKVWDAFFANLCQLYVFKLKACNI